MRRFSTAIDHRAMPVPDGRRTAVIPLLRLRMLALTSIGLFVAANTMDLPLLLVAGNARGEHQPQAQGVPHAQPATRMALRESGMPPQVVASASVLRVPAVTVADGVRRSDLERGSAR